MQGVFGHIQLALRREAPPNLEHDAPDRQHHTYQSRFGCLPVRDRCAVSAHQPKQQRCPPAESPFQFRFRATAAFSSVFSEIGFLRIRAHDLQLLQNPGAIFHPTWMEKLGLIGRVMAEFFDEFLNRGFALRYVAKAVSRLRGGYSTCSGL